MDQFKGQFSVLLIRDTQMRENKKKMCVSHTNKRESKKYQEVCACDTQIREKQKKSECVCVTH